MGISMMLGTVLEKIQNMKERQCFVWEKGLLSQGPGAERSTATFKT